MRMNVKEVILMKRSKGGNHLFGFMNNEDIEILIKLEDLEKLLDDSNDTDMCPLRLINLEAE